MKNVLTVHEAVVRAYDSASGRATVVIPGVYGMEPIEAMPFTHQQNATEFAVLQPGNKVLVTMMENESPEWIHVDALNYVTQETADARYVNVTGDVVTGSLTMNTGTNAPFVIHTPSSQDASIVFQQPAGTNRGILGCTSTGNMSLNASTGTLTLIAASGVLLGNAQGSAVNAVVRKDYADLLVNGGAATLTTDAAGVMDIAHGLGRTPVSWTGIPHGTGNYICVSPAGRSPDGTTFPLQIISRSAGTGVASTSVTVRWIAL